MSPNIDHHTAQRIASLRKFCPSVSQSVCPSVTFVSPVKTTNKNAWNDILFGVVFSERELKFMFAICHRPSVCRLSVVCLSSVVCRL